MNKTFKVVFNRSRGSLMVANEITSSVQKKGTKTVLATAVLALMASSAMAASPAPQFKWTSESLPTGSSFSYVVTDVPATNTYPVAILATSGATGNITNAVVSLVANNDEHPNPAATRALFFCDGNIVFDGDTATFSVESNYAGGGNSELSSLTSYTEGKDQKAIISAKKATFTTKATYETGKSAYGIVAYGSKGEDKAAYIDFTGDEVSITVDSNVDRTTNSLDKNRRGNVVGASLTYGYVTSTADKVDITVNSTGVTPEAAGVLEGNKYKEAATDNKVGAAEATGIATIAGGFSNTGETNITVTAVGGSAKGLSVNDHFYTSVTGSVETTTKASIKLADATIGVTSMRENATGIHGSQTTAGSQGVLVDATGNVSVVTSSKGSGKSAYAVDLTGGIVSLGSKDKEVSLTAVASDARAFNITNGGTLKIGSADSSPKSVTLGVNKDSQYLGLVEGTGSAVNIYADTYTQAGSKEGILVKDGGAFNLTGNTVTTGNLSATNGGTASVKANKSLNLTGNILVTEGTNPASARIESVKSTITGNVNVAGTGNTASIKTGDGSTFTGNLTATKGGKITLNGGAYTVSVLNLDDTSNLDATNATINLSAATKGGKLTLKGTTNVSTTLATAFEGITLDELSQATVCDSGVSARLDVTSDSEKTAKVTVTNAFTYTGTILKAMEDAYSYVTLALENARLKTDAKQKTEVSQDITGDVITGGGDIALKEAVTVKIDAKEDSEKSVIGAVDLGEKAANLVTANTTATIDSIKSTNEGSAITLEKSKVEVSKAIENAGTLTVDKGTNLKAESITSKGTVTIGSGSSVESKDIKLTETTSNLEVKGKSVVKVTNFDSAGLVNLTEKSTVTATTLTGTGTINVGSTEGEGLGAKLDIGTLKMTGGRIFVDPAYGSGYGDSVLRIGSLADGKLNTGVVVGRGALVIIGATEKTANDAVDSLGIFTQQPFVYVGTPINLKGDTTSGYVVVDTNATTHTSADGGSVILTSGALVIDQNAIGKSAVFTNAESVYATGDATIGVVNSKANTSITLATNSDGAATSITLGEGTTDVMVATDSPFVVGSLDAVGGKINLKATMPEEGMDVLASTGVQTMIRRADMVLAETIADRTVCPQKKSGLWATVRGEQFKQTKLGNGAGLKANMGYGAFGGEVSFKKNFKLGAAVQYGHGTVKGETHNVKNKTKDLSATLYGTYNFASSGVKLLAEVAYTKSENKITNSFHSSLNQDLDAKMYSAGLTVMKNFKLGDFNITPSLGVRASRIETDAMKVGTDTVKKQEHDILQVPIALRVASKGIKTESGAVFVPHAKVAYVPTFGDKELKVYDAKRNVIDTSPVQAALGVSYIKGKLAVDLTANGGIGNRGTKSVGAKVGLTYRF